MALYILFFLPWFICRVRVGLEEPGEIPKGSAEQLGNEEDGRVEEEGTHNRDYPVSEDSGNIVHYIQISHIL